MSKPVTVEEVLKAVLARLEKHINDSNTVLLSQDQRLQKLETDLAALDAAFTEFLKRAAGIGATDEQKNVN